MLTFFLSTLGDSNTPVYYQDSVRICWLSKHLQLKMLKLAKGNYGFYHILNNYLENVVIPACLQKKSRRQHVALLKWLRVSSKVRMMVLNEARNSCSRCGSVNCTGAVLPRADTAASATGSGGAWLARATTNPSSSSLPSQRPRLLMLLQAHWEPLSNFCSEPTDHTKSATFPTIYTNDFEYVSFNAD